ncbi:MAG: shikimate kinase [Caldithrix sp.]|nr:shikimate kinase [Caldithrix sp.]
MAKKHLFLTGFMGAGKSRIGRELSRKTGLPFFDTDKLIEEREKKSIKTIFDDDGEEFFRKLEKEIVQQMCRQPYPAIIALGGGALQNIENFRQATKSGIIIYIQSDPQFIFERIRHSNKRPLLNLPHADNYENLLMEKIRELLDKREHIYQKSDIVFNRDGMELELITDRLLELIQKQRTGA